MASYYDYPAPPRRPSLLGLWPWLFVLGAVTFVAWYYWPQGSRDPGPVQVKLRDEAPNEGYGPGELANKRVYERDKDCVVGVNSYALRRDRFRNDITEVPEGAGSGFVWDERGFIVTNFHVIQHADGAEVTFADGASYNAKIWGVAPDQDLAVLFVDAPKDKLKPIPIGSSKDLWVGQNVWAIGNPFGVGQSLTTGIISALNREIKSVTDRPISGVIQTDASINPGNSGGPLLDSSARLIGVNTAIASPSGGSTGVGFAIPVDTVNRVVTQLINDRKMVRAGLGVQLAGDNERGPKQPGVLVAGVVPRGPAAQAGLRAGDVIVSLDDKPLHANKQLFQALAERKVGDRVKLVVLRGGGEMAFDVTLAPI